MPTDTDLSTAEDVVDTAAVADTSAQTAANPADKGPAADKAADKGTLATEKPGTDKVPADKGKTIATGADDDAEAAADAKAQAEKAADRTEDIKKLRDALAKHYSAGDKKAYDKEMKRLERLGIERPEQVYGLYRELDNKLNGGGLVKIPGKDAKPEEIEAFKKALSVPEKAEDYLKDIKLDNGAILGEADKPIATAFAGAMHQAGAPPATVHAALNWYYKHQEEQAAALDDADDTFRREATHALKDELGPAYNRKINAIGTLFATAPGGTDVNNGNSLYARLMGGRTADGRIIGNDPDMVRFLVGLVNEINPIASVVEDGSPSAMSIDSELAEIKKLRTTDPKRYNSEVVQARELELLTAQQKHQARNRA